MPDSTDAARALLHDAFGRVRGLVEAVTDGLDQDAATYRPAPEANTIGWLVWHLTRIQDDHLSAIAGTEQVWTSRGWSERFGLPFDDGATGYGQSSDDVGQVVADGALLAGYHADVHAFTDRFIDTLEPGDLDRIVDRNWNPPVTMGVRLVSIISDCLQHGGQAAYVRGLH